MHAAAAIPGVRVLTIERLEALITFMGSANNNIKRNMQMVSLSTTRLTSTVCCCLLQPPRRPLPPGLPPVLPPVLPRLGRLQSSVPSLRRTSFAKIRMEGSTSPSRQWSRL